MPASTYETDLFSAVRLFRPWPRPVVRCPQCEDIAMRAVAVRIVHGARETIIDSSGIRAHPAEALMSGQQRQRFALELTFQCRKHESILRITPEEGGILRAVVEAQPVEQVRTPIGWPSTKPTRRVRTGIVRLVDSETTR